MRGTIGWAACNSGCNAVPCWQHLVLHAHLLSNSCSPAIQHMQTCKHSAIILQLWPSYSGPSSYSCVGPVPPHQSNTRCSVSNSSFGCLACSFAGHVPHQFITRYCFGAAYVVALLHGRLALGLHDQSLHFTNSISRPVRTMDWGQVCFMQAFWNLEDPNNVSWSV